MERVKMTMLARSFTSGYIDCYEKFSSLVSVFLCKSAYRFLSLVYRISGSFSYNRSQHTGFSEHLVSQFEEFPCKVSYCMLKYLESE